MTSDIQAILQLLQRQTTAGPPAYSTVTSSPEYHRPTIRVQPASALQPELSLGPAPARPQVHTPRYLLHTQSQKIQAQELVCAAVFHHHFGPGTIDILSSRFAAVYMPGQ